MTTTTGMSFQRRAMVMSVGVFALLAVAAALASTAWACSVAAPSTSISPKLGEPGTQVTVSGTNYAAAPVEIRWNGATGSVLATTQGPTFSQQVTLPADAEAGMFYIAAVQHDAAGSVSYKVADTIELTTPAAAGAPELSVSPASATGDLWSGFDPDSTLSMSSDAPTAASSASWSSWSLPVGLGLMIVGAAALFGGFAFAEVRRRRATAV